MAAPLSDILCAVRLTGGVFLDARFTAPWCVTSNMDAGDCQPFLQRPPKQLIGYHVVIDGRLLVVVGGEAPIEVRAGEVVLFPRNDGHVLASDLGQKPVSASRLIQRAADDNLARIVHGGGGEPTHVVCGFLATEEAFDPLIATLPRALKLDLREGTARDWIESSVRFAATEIAQGRLGSSTVLSRLSEVLLIEAVRAYASALPMDEVGWLKGMSDPHISRALAMIHGDLSRQCSTAGLADHAGLSRSAFAARFVALIGMPPMRYVTFWRLQSAKMRLSDTHRNLNQLAHDVGYGSEAAFSRAFKRMFGVSPAHWRERSGVSAT